MHAANFLKLCILWIFYSYAHRFAMQQCRSKFSEPMHICNALVHMQIFWSLHAANFLQLCIPIPKTCICKFSRAMQIANFLEICMHIFNASIHMQIFWSYAYLRAHDLRTEWKIFKDFSGPTRNHRPPPPLDKIGKCKIWQRRKITPPVQANSERILKGQCDENIVWTKRPRDDILGQFIL